jgi:hypothetical protein
MDDLFKIDINSPVPEFSYLPFINLIPLIAAGALPFSVGKKYQKCYRCACCYERFCEG